MKNKRLTITVFLLLIIAIISIVIFLLTNNFTFSLLLFTYFSVFVLLSHEVENNIFFLAFLIAFFVFLMGRPIDIELFNIQKSEAIFLDPEARQQIYICLTISLVGLVTGYKLVKNKNESNNMVNEEYILILKKISRILSIILYIFVILENISRLIVIKNVGYTASYTGEYSYILPFGLHFFVVLAPIALAIFFATLPSKKETMIPLGLYVLSFLIVALSGSRFEIVSGCLFIIVYFILRNNIEEQKWISYKTLGKIILVSPLFLVVLQNMIYWRDGNKTTMDENPILNFMYGVGGSSDMIGYAYKYGDKYLDDMQHKLKKWLYMVIQWQLL